MRRVKFIILIIFLIIINICVVEAKCDNSYLSDLRSLSTNVNFSYDYYIENNEAVFNVTVNNLTLGMYIVDNETNLKYTYDNTVNGEITFYGYKDVSKVSYSLYALGNGCDDKKLITKNILLPNYNIYHNSEICEGIEEFSACKRWSKQNINYNSFMKQVEKYKESLNNKKVEDSKIIIQEDILDKIIHYYSKYYYLSLIVIIVLCLIVIFYQNKKNRFKL